MLLLCYFLYVSDLNNIIPYGELVLINCTMTARKIYSFSMTSPKAQGTSPILSNPLIEMIYCYSIRKARWRDTHKGTKIRSTLPISNQLKTTFTSSYFIFWMVSQCAEDLIHFRMINC